MMNQRKNTTETDARINTALQQWFLQRGLALSDVWHPGADELQVQNRSLQDLQSWAAAYLCLGNREKMEQAGFTFPPISPRLGAGNDWTRFELWMRGQPVRWSYTKEFGALRPAESLSQQELGDELELISSNLESRGVVVALQEAVPPPLAYGLLKRILEEEDFDVTEMEAFTILDGCGGYCPGCVQRPWCEVGLDPSWPEDFRLNGVVVPAEVLQYVGGKEVPRVVEHDGERGLAI